jgi:hypothetical protein
MAFFASLISQKRNLSHPEAENEAHFWPDFVQILPFSLSSADMSHFSSVFPSISNLVCLFDQPKKGITPCGYYSSINHLLCFFNSQKKESFSSRCRK